MDNGQRTSDNGRRATDGVGSAVVFLYFNGVAVEVDVGEEFLDVFRLVFLEVFIVLFGFFAVGCQEVL